MLARASLIVLALASPAWAVLDPFPPSPDFGQ